MTRLLAVLAGGVAVLLLTGSETWSQISRLGRPLTACADLRTSPGKHPGLRPASTTAMSPSRWLGAGKLALPGRAR
jgi:hypothetical protein